MTADWRIPQRPALRRKFLRAHAQPVTPSRGAGAARNLFWARNGIHLGLRALGVGSGAAVLVPAFICRSVPEAVLATGAAVEYYRVDPQAMVDVDELRGKLRGNVRAVVVVHYFGCLQRGMADLRRLCDQRGILLLEDCAHLLMRDRPPGTAGTLGHLRVFSWRKFVPAYDGGGLILDSPARAQEGPGLARRAGIEMRAVKNLLEQGLAAARGDGRSSRRSPDPRRASPSPSTTDGVPPAVAETMPRETAFDPNADGFDASLAWLPMSRASEWILEHTDLDAVVAARRANWRQLHEAATETGGMLPLAGGLGDAVAPWTFALRFPAAIQAHRTLRAMGIPAATWDGVRPASLPPGAFPEAEELYRNLVFLPVHQDLEAADLEIMTGAMRQVARSAGSRP